MIEFSIKCLSSEIMIDDAFTNNMKNGSTGYIGEKFLKKSAKNIFFEQGIGLVDYNTVYVGI